MGERTVLYAIAESCPFDAVLVREMKRSVDSLLKLNLKRFRVPQQSLAKYSALDIVKQALELLFEFSPSEKNYREAVRTIRVYSEGDYEMLTTIESSFRLFANAVYSVYTSQRRIEFLGPQTLFFQGISFEPSELQRSFRYVGVRPPEISPPSVQRTVFLDEGFEPYKALLEGKVTEGQAEEGREEYWARVISQNLGTSGKNLIRAGWDHLSAGGLLGTFRGRRRGRLPMLLRKSGIEIQVIDRVADVNKVFGK
jgi:hypothetical protein